MKYTQITIEVDTKDLYFAEGLAQIRAKHGIWVENNEDINALSTQYSEELFDDDLKNLNTDRSKVHFFVSEDDDEQKDVDALKSTLDFENVNYEITTRLRDEEEYANSWKTYYKPVRPYKKIVIVPSWEKYQVKKGEIKIDLDPGMAFGTGLHETTRLCIRLLEEHLKPGDAMMDIGTGSGILSISGMKLGASRAVGTDIDKASIRVAKENAQLNGLADEIEFTVSDLTTGIEGKFDIITANIVADVVIELLDKAGGFLEDDGIFITSGIIDTRKNDVVDALSKKGYKIIEELEEGGWIALAAVKK